MDTKLDLFAFLRSLVRHKTFILLFVIIVSIVAVVYSLIVPKYWESYAVISVSSSGSALPGSLKGLISGYSANLSNLSGNEEAASQMEILKSRSIGEKAIKRFHLLDYFNIAQSDRADTLKARDEALRALYTEVISFSLDEVTGNITIVALTKDKALSRDLADFFVSELDSYNREQRITKGRAKREFLEKRVQQVEQDINDSNVALTKFQQENNILDLDQQVKEGIGSYGEILKQKITTATELEIALSYYSKNNPKVEEITKKLQALNSQIDKMQSESISKYVPSFDSVNALALQYAKQKMHIEIQAEIYKSLIPQLELAKLEELNDLTTIQYIQHPTLDGLREKPKRAKMCIISFLCAIIFACLISFLYDLLMTQKDKFIAAFKEH